jgi:hypothetical protein
MLTKSQCINFETLCRAFDDGQVCLLQAKRLADDATVAVICTISQTETGELLLTPFAELVSTNPYTAYAPDGVTLDPAGYDLNLN